jgi:hypothetical protein
MKLSSNAFADNTAMTGEYAFAVPDAVNHYALDACGYQASSRFSMRFKQRFGFSLQGIR